MPIPFNFLFPVRPCVFLNPVYIALNRWFNTPFLSARKIKQDGVKIAG